MSCTKWTSEFSNRFNRHKTEFSRLFNELYHNDVQAYEAFVGMMYEAYLSRPEVLKGIDRAREANPDWYKGHYMVGMLLYVNAFAGTLRGVQEKLGYIQDCGVNYLHLMPLLESPKGSIRNRRSRNIRSLQRSGARSAVHHSRYSRI